MKSIANKLDVDSVANRSVIDEDGKFDACITYREVDQAIRRGRKGKYLNKER